jgi:dCTP deaminase
MDRLKGGRLMGILSHKAIEIALRQGLVIEPRPEIIQPTSVDLHLSGVFSVPNKLRGPVLIDPLRDDVIGYEKLNYGRWVLFPGDFILGSTAEWIELPKDLVGILTGKSSLARIGLQVECAGYVDPGWKGNLTLEIVNLGRDTIVLRSNMPICQIRFETITGETELLYGDSRLNSHYQGSQGPVSARFALPSTAGNDEPAPA